jgi:hypothetical protein
VITDFFINMLAGIVTGIASLIPSWTADTSILNSVAGFSYSIGELNGWVPEDTALGCLLILVLLGAIVFGWRGLVFLYSMIPFN